MRKSIWIACVFVYLGIIQTAAAQFAGGAILLRCHVGTGTLEVTGGQTFTIACVPGTSYDYYFLPSANSMMLEPADATGNAEPGDLMWSVSGTPKQNIIFQFVLPYAFLSASTDATIPITYDNRSANFVNESGNIYTWNPDGRSPVATLGTAGTGTLYLGFRFSVPINTPASNDYTAVFYVSAESTGF